MHHWSFETAKIMESISSMSQNALISSQNKARGFESTEKPLDVDEDEFIELELLELGQMTKLSQFHQKNK